MAYAGCYISVGPPGGSGPVIGAEFYYFNVLSLEERTKELKVFKGNFCPEATGQNR